MDTLPTKITWIGEENRPLNVQRHCDCGTCTGSVNRTAPDSTGYLTWSDEEGHGGSVFVNEEQYQELDALLKTDPFVTLVDCLSMLNLS